MLSVDFPNGFQLAFETPDVGAGRRGLVHPPIGDSSATDDQLISEHARHSSPRSDMSCTLYQASFPELTHRRSSPGGRCVSFCVVTQALQPPRRLMLLVWSRPGRPLTLRQGLGRSLTARGLVLL